MIGYLLPEYTIVNNDEIYLTVCQTIIQVKMKYQYKCQIINLQMWNTIIQFNNMHEKL